ncbi:HU family DNA-binding protein [Acinetobacter ursingii]|uniref:HU family DNA-binding protein n=1 Tax=Acinetobacter ursingii TaxID=108980 RepID=UPI000F7A3F13|nr:HU family DNA-binding protein [Acinetobacter ursingii]MCU4306223.1 HU family DNA-binding protein [Acinetobacter ursingii]MCU4372308.1 HU family DNA-binding protein [Acinetobacter ursingii]RSO80068.1 HU family DNA-binding protein [Acinetobacter ursingii]
MNKSELIKAIYEKTPATKDNIAQIVDAFTTVVTEELANGGEVALVGFGTFKVSDRAARTGRNPKTGEVLEIAASKVPTFKAGKALKEAVD